MAVAVDSGGGSIIPPGFLFSPCFLAINFAISNLDGCNFVRCPNFRPPNMGKKSEIIVQIFLTLTHPTLC